ncbi:hypothetical protein [Bacillus sp. EAC]|uniref:WD40/YVTN/BNR-like repeat-containing protein n=1 Tax=Bacillus sp. EAC TaxID=1978338 RepID=UPI000B45085C|nr:hypothetical protein [Bacillus sp. EAC]
MNNMFSSTAVSRTESGSVVLATSNNGLLIEKDGHWIHSLSQLNYHIRDLKCVGKMIYGVGENGVFIKSENEGKDWSIKHFPTKASVWSLCCNSKGLVIAHGEKVIYISTNFGETWKVISPFTVNNSPSIRSLCLFEDKLFIGTKIHPENGGIWMLDLNTFESVRVKVETEKMISSMLVHDELLVAVSGSCRGKNGVLEFIPLPSIRNKSEHKWNACYSADGQGSYLDICAHNGILFTSSTQNESGYSTVSRVYLEKQLLVPCDYVKGHGWRICNENENYIVAGQHETRVYLSNAQRVC